MASKYAGIVQDELRDLRGNAMQGAVVIVRELGTTTPATVYNNPVLIASAAGGDSLINDASTGLPAASGLLQPGLDANGNYTFYADADVSYDLRVLWNGLTFDYRVRPKVVDEAYTSTADLTAALSGTYAGLDATGVVAPPQLDGLVALFAVKRYAKTTAQRVAVGDGTTTPLSTFYASLAAAQVDFPHALALTDELDWAVGQAAINAGMAYFDKGTYRINRAFVLTTGTTATLHPAVEIRQTAATTHTFIATAQDNVWIHCNGAVLYGEGSWSSSWTGNSPNREKGVAFVGCTRSGVTNPTIKNMANSGIYVAGGSRIKIVNPTIEGTHNYSTPLGSGDNFQNGIEVRNDATYGAYSDVTIVTPTISDTNQGIVVTDTTSGSAGSLGILGATIKDIRGQHGFYVSASNVSVWGATVTNPALAGLKIQASSGAMLSERVTLMGITVRDAASQAFEFVGLDGGEVRGLLAVGLNAQGCRRGVTVSGLVTKSRINSVVIDRSGAQHGVLVDGSGPADLWFSDISVIGAGESGVLVQPSAGGRIRFRNVFILNPVTGAGTFMGFRTHLAADVHIDGLEIQDDSANMHYGLYHSGAALTVSGNVRIRGAKFQNVRADAVISEWPAAADVADSYTNTALVRFSGATTFKAQTTSTTNVVVWRQTLDDESAYIVRAEIIGKLADSTERRGIVSTVVAYRDAGGGATIQGAADEDVSIASASFAGVYSWTVSGNDLRLSVNSGAAATIGWCARVSVTRIAA